MTRSRRPTTPTSGPPSRGTRAGGCAWSRARGRVRRAGRQGGVEPGDVGRRDHDVARLAVGEVEDVVEELLLRERDHAVLSAWSTSARSSSALRIVSPATTLSIPNGRRSSCADRCSSHTSGREHPPDHLDRARDQHRERLGAVERERLRHQLAEHDAEVRDDRERQDEADPRRQGVAEELADERLRHRAGDDPERRDPDLNRRDDAHRVVHQAQGGRHAPSLPRGERGAPRGHDGVLGDHEERVAGDEDEDREDAEGVGHSRRTVPPGRPVRGCRA